MSATPKLPCVILTGFLGSGKTTLLNRLLTDAEFQDSAVLVNEFGEVSLDHDLIVHSEDRLVVLAGGCICCALREDVEGALRQLFQARDAGTVPPFSRIVIETTGLADPVPLLVTLQAFGLARERLEAPLVVTAVDAGLHGATVAHHSQALRQLAIAHLVLVTKADLVGPAQAKQVLSDAARLNPWARVEIVPEGAGGSWLADLLRERQAAASSSLHEHLAALPRVEGAWLAGKYRKVDEAHGAVSFPVFLDGPVDWSAFGIWMTLLLHRHGSRILRIKGLLHVTGLNGPVVIHAAQHMVHPPQHLDRWPSEDRRTRLVFIVEGLAPEAILRSMNVFLRASQATPVSVGAHHVGAGAGGTVRGRPIRRPTAPRWIRG